MRALGMEVDGKLCVGTHARIWLFVGIFRMFMYRRVHGRFSVLDLKGSSRQGDEIDRRFE